MQLAPPRKRRRPSLTPMIDVVFLLLVFFMLASRFGSDVMIDLPMASASDSPYQGPPRLIDVTPDTLSLNGFEMTAQTLVEELRSMMQTPQDAIILRPRDDADLQRVVTVMEDLRQAGFDTLILLE